MVFNRTAIPGVYLVELAYARDERGFFGRAWSLNEFGDQGLETSFPEINLSSSSRKGTIRGFHYQTEPHSEAKFVRCTRGALFDVVIDLRAESPTLYRWTSFMISWKNHHAVYIPAGCAHGVQTLVDDTEMFYMVSSRYHASAERGIRWNDPFFDVQWPEVGLRNISEKDQNWPDFKIDSREAARMVGK